MRALEIAGSDSASICRRLLRRAGAQTLAVEPGRGVLAELVGRCNVLLRPAWVPNPFPLREDQIELVGPDWEAPSAVGRRRGSSEIWGASLAGTSLAIAAAVGLLGGDAATVDVARDRLLAEQLFPIPKGSCGAAEDPCQSSDGPHAGWPTAATMRAADGWVVTGPTRLPVEALSGLVGLPAPASPAAAEAALAAWVLGQTRAAAVQTLQPWRTSFTPALDELEAEGLEPADIRHDPASGADPRAALATWLGVSLEEAEDLLEPDAVMVGR